MSEALQQFHFLRPWWLAALALLPLVAWVGARAATAQAQLSRLVDAELLPHVLDGRERGRHLALWLFLAAWVLCSLALAGPTWSRVSKPLYAKRAAQVVAISLSKDMLARDVAPSRLDRARQKAHDLLAGNRDGLNALVGYAGAAFVVAPLTADERSLGDLLDAMAPDTMPVPGNDAAQAIALGVKLIRDASLRDGTVVLITDQADASADVAARAARAAGVQVSVLGVGTSQGGPVPLPGGDFLRDEQGRLVLARRDDAALSALAAAGGGRYVAMTADQDDVHALHAQLRTARAKTTTAETGDAWLDRGPWLLLPLLLLVALSFRRGWLLLVPLVVLPLLPGNAEAMSWRDLWQRPDQQAAQALRDGQPKRAQQLAQDPALRGAAAYRAGDYAAAVRSFQEAAGADAAYDLGNALAKQRHYQQAIAAYDRALKLDPDHADARANRKALEDWLRKQQAGKQGNPQQSGKSGDKSQSGKGDQGQNGEQNKQQGGDGKDGKPAPQDGKPESSQGSDQNADQSNQQSGQRKADEPPKPQTAEQRAAQQQQAAEAQQALKQQLDQELADKKAGQPPVHQLGTLAPDDPEAKLPAAVRQALQRVPDDPGALLRRKFELEYQQRQGDAGGQQP